MRFSRWKQVGTVAVDSGTVAIVDPDNYEPVSMDWLAERVSEQIVPLEVDGPEGRIVIGAIVATAMGDGIYPIEARFKGGRVAEVRVRFL